MRTARLSIVLGCLLLFSLPSFSQTSDRELVQQALEDASAPKKDTTSHKVYHLFRHQMRGVCYYEPECVEFFPQAVKDLGFGRAVLSTTDRLTRCTYIGTASFPQGMKGQDGKIHEGTKAYRRRHKKK